MSVQSGGVDPTLAPRSRRGTEGSLVLGCPRWVLCTACCHDLCSLYFHDAGMVCAHALRAMSAHSVDLQACLHVRQLDTVHADYTEALVCLRLLSDLLV